MVDGGSMLVLVSRQSRRLRNKDTTMTGKTETLRYEAVDMIDQMVFAHCQNADVPRPKLSLLPVGGDEKIITIQVKADNRVTERSWYYTTMDLDGVKDAAWTILAWSHPDIFEA